MSRQEIQVGRLCLFDDTFRIQAVYDTLIYAAVNVFGVKAYARSGVRLRIGIY